MLCCVLSGIKYHGAVDEYRKYYDDSFPEFENHFNLPMPIKDIYKFTEKYKDNVKEKTGKTLAINVFEIEQKSLNPLLITRDCEVLQNDESIDLGVTMKAKEDITDAAADGKKDWIGRDPETEYH